MTDEATLPVGVHVAMSDWVAPSHSGLVRQTLVRSSELATRFDVPVELLSFMPPPEGRTTVADEAAVRELGLLAPGVTVHNMWEDLATWAPHRWKGFDPAFRRRRRFLREARRRLRRARKRRSVRALLQPRAARPLDVCVVSTDGRTRIRMFESVATRTRVEVGRVEVDRRRFGRWVMIGGWRGEWSLRRFWLHSRYGNQTVHAIIDTPEVADSMVHADLPAMVITYVNHFPYRGGRPGWDFLAPKRGHLFRYASQLDALVFPTSSERRVLEDNPIGTDETPNLHAIPNLVPRSRARPARRDERRGVVLARADQMKRVDHAITVASLLPDVRIDLFLRGRDGLHREGPEMERLTSLAEHVPNVAMHLDTTNADEELERSGFLLSTSRAEGFGLTMVEAMAAGCIPIAYDIKHGPNEIITPGVDGYLVRDLADQDDFSRAAGDLAAAIVDLLGLDAADRARMRSAARESAKRFEPAALIPEWSKVLNVAADRHRLSPRRGASEEELGRLQRVSLHWRTPSGRTSPMPFAR